VTYSIRGFGAFVPGVSPDIDPETGLPWDEERRKQEEDRAIQERADKCMNTVKGAYNFITNECVCQFGFNAATGTCFQPQTPNGDPGSGGGGGGGGAMTHGDIPEILVSGEEVQAGSTGMAGLATLMTGLGFIAIGGGLAYLVFGGASPVLKPEFIWEDDEE
jgi:hypothetical protein